MPWSLDHVILHAPGRHEASLPGGPVLTANLPAGAALSIRRTREGDRISLAAPTADLTWNGAAVALRGLEAHLAPLTGGEPGDLALRVGLVEAELAGPPDRFPWLGDRLGPVRVSAVLPQGASRLAADPLEALAGRLTPVGLPLAYIGWGPLQAQARGEIGLDALNRPRAVLEVRSDTPEAVEAAIETVAPLGPEGRQAMQLFTSLSANGGYAGFAVDDGIVRMGPFQLFAVDPLF
jgi:hypothetical protein